MTATTSVKAVLYCNGRQHQVKSALDSHNHKASQVQPCWQSMQCLYNSIGVQLTFKAQPMIAALSSDGMG